MLLDRLISCAPQQAAEVGSPSEIPLNEEDFIALSDSITFQTLYEVTGLTPLPDTIILHGDTLLTIIQVLVHQPFNAPFTFTRISGNNYDDKVNLDRFLVEHDSDCSYPLVGYKDRRPFEPCCYLILEKYSKTIPSREWKKLVQLIWDNDLTEIAYLPRRGSLMDGDYLTFKYLEADAFEYLDFDISRGAPGEKSSLQEVVNFLNGL
jgi:hypothetical protein